MNAFIEFLIPDLRDGSDDMISCPCWNRRSGAMLVAMNDFTDATPTSTAAEKDSQKKASDDVADKFCELVERFHADLAGLCDIVDLTSELEFNVG